MRFVESVGPPLLRSDGSEGPSCDKSHRHLGGEMKCRRVACQRLRGCCQRTLQVQRAGKGVVVGTW